MIKRWFGLVVAGVAFIASLLMWSRLAPEIATHWNIRGEADGWSSRTFAALFMPGMILAMTGLLNVLPRIDPRGANYARFQDVYWKVGNGVLLFLLVIHLATLASGAGAGVSVVRVICVSIGLLLVVLGNYLGRLRPNWFMGIRTPWTLDSPEVWRRTHRLGGWMFVGAGVISLVAALMPGDVGLTVAFAAIMASSLGSIVVSFVFWKQEKQRGAGA